MEIKNLDKLPEKVQKVLKPYLNELVKIYGEDLGVLRSKSVEITAAIADVPGLVDLASEQGFGQPGCSLPRERPFHPSKEFECCTGGRDRISGSAGGQVRVGEGELQRDRDDHTDPYPPVREHAHGEHRSRKRAAAEEVEELAHHEDVHRDRARLFLGETP